MVRAQNCLRRPPVPALGGLRTDLSGGEYRRSACGGLTTASLVLNSSLYDNCMYMLPRRKSPIMPTVSIRDLARRSSQVVEDVSKSGRPAIITRRGKPVGALIAIDPDELEDFVLANAPEYARSMRDADADLATGRTRTLADVVEDLGAEKAS